ncbi:hypothetical protein [Nakamurella leprariae]|uniref:Lipoprotein n=1 Tax=Nakamurella leprariae TaxID=2803911 RepID=A0A939BZ78_9ACTN|nr:hypothetical protein [Nakamurella leprariae]MBM9467411.1 hypothetical protein [Nakamurella leprariae]
MKRTTTMLAGLLTAGTLVLAGCGSDDPAPASSNSAPSSSSSSSEASSSAPSTSSSGSASSSSSSAAQTAGGDTTELDAQSAAWFETACDGLAPIAEIPDQVTTITSGASDTPEARQQALAQLGQILTQTGDGLVNTGDTLADTPPPTFENGEALAQSGVDAMRTIGTEFQRFGAEIPQIDVNDPAAAQQKFTEFGQTMEQAGSTITDFDVPATLRSAIGELPACEPIFG